MSLCTPNGRERLEPMIRIVARAAVAQAAENYLCCDSRLTLVSKLSYTKRFAAVHWVAAAPAFT